MAENVSAPAPTPGVPSSSTPPAPAAKADSGKASPPKAEGTPFKDVAKAKTDAPAEETKVPEAVEKPSRKRKIVVDGAEEEYDLDALNDDDIVRHLQLSKAGQKRMQEAAEVRKQFAEIQKFIKENPFEALKDPIFGVDIEQMAQERLAQKYQEATMSPEEKAQADLKKELETYKKAEATRKQEAETRSQQELDERIFRETEATFLKALTEEGLPNLPETLSMMADVARVNHQNKIGLDQKQLAAEVRARLNTTSRNVIGSLKGEALLKHLGPETVKEVLRLSVERVKKAKAPAFVAPPATKQDITEADRPERKRMSPQAFREFLKK